MGAEPTWTIRSVIAGGWSDFRRAWRPLLAFAVAFKAFSGLVLAPTAAWLIARLVSASGHTAGSNSGIVSVLTSPPGAIAALILGTELLALELLGQTGILAIARIKLCRGRASPRSSIAATVAAVGRVLRLGMVQCLALEIVASPFIILGGLA